MQNKLCALVVVLACLLSGPLVAGAERTTLSLDGVWQIADSKSADAMPTAFNHTVPVPGLANLAAPAFADVDKFTSRENLVNRIRAKLAPEEWLNTHWKGKVEQERNYFWYRRTFRAPAARQVALVKINKAQFGTAVWLNGQKLGEYAGCFTASCFPAAQAIRWNAENTLLVRIGAHPAVLPDNFPTGSDFEKIKWTPGIYDSVSLVACDNPVIEAIQVAPQIAQGQIVVQTRLKNYGAAPVTTALAHCVAEWRSKKQVSVEGTTGTPPSPPAPLPRAGEGSAMAPAEKVALKPGEERTLTQTIAIPQAHLWSPEDPFLYVVQSSTAGDTRETRFGMREFRFDGASKRAYLNGKVYYLRGSNITLHRFFEDPLCRDLPWREDWVRKLLGELPKKMHWNYFRFCIGPVPDRWLEICDEVGLLIQNEFFVWTGGPGWYKGYSRTHDADEMIRQYRDWMRDNWNHPSVAVWDANNETKDAMFGEKIIPAVRGLDLSNRPWENSYNRPVGPIDPVEDHPYLMISGYRGKQTFHMTNLETMDGRPKPGKLPSDKHAPLVNEYGWLWLNRDGSPTLLTENVYAQLMGRDVTPRARLDMYSYLLGAKTEFWRAHRHYAGVIHFVYLTCSYPGVYTADHFRDVTRLELDPAFADYMGEAFRPLGVYINFFQPKLAPGAVREFLVKMVNDEGRPAKGRLTLTLETRAGKVLAQAEQPFALPALGAGDFRLTLRTPGAPQSDLVLKATARPQGGAAAAPTVSRRWVAVAP